MARLSKRLRNRGKIADNRRHAAMVLAKYARRA
jgi:hypothetical protein